MTNLITTSVKVDEINFKNFKTTCIVSNFNLQKLVNRAMFLYMNDADVREKLNNLNNLSIDGKI